VVSADVYMPHRLRILHISDLHERVALSGMSPERTAQVQHGAASRYRVFNTNFLDVLESIKHEYPVDIICFTGDVADWGLPEEYKLAESRIRSILAALGSSVEKFFVVPGNHDVQRVVAKDEWEEIKKLAKEDIDGLSLWMAGGIIPYGAKEVWRQNILNRTSDFWSWVGSQLGRADLLPENNPHKYLGYRLQANLPALPFPVHIIGLDSAWLSGDDNDSKKLLLTEGQVNRLASDSHGNYLPGFRIILCHHPLSDLADGGDCRRHLADSIDLFLHGHVHETLTEFHTDPDKSLLSIAAGSLYEGDKGDKYVNGFHVIDVYLNSEGRPRKYDFGFWGWSRNGFWHRNCGVYQHAANGKLTLFPTSNKSRQFGEISSYWNIPHRRNEFFSGRRTILDTLHDGLTHDSERQSPYIVGLIGLGGVGKTQISIEFAYSHRSEFHNVIWVRADSHANLTRSFFEAAKQLNISGASATDHEATIHGLLNWFADNAGWLLVFDNADDIDILPQYIPKSGVGSILITSRACDLGAIGIRNVFNLSEFPPEDSLEFILRRTNRSDISEEESTAARQLCIELGHLPLALEQAGAFISAKSCQFQVYLKSYRSRRLELLEKGRPPIGEYSESVATTWNINFEAVAQESPAAAELLRVIAYLYPEDIPLELILWGSAELSVLIQDALSGYQDNPLVLDELVEPVIRFSLVRRNVAAQTISIHRLVQEVIRDNLSAPEQHHWMERIVRAIDKCFLMPTEYENWPFCRRLIPHALRAVNYFEGKCLKTESPGHLLNRLGCYLSEHAYYRDANDLLQQSLLLRKESLGEKHPYIAETVSNIGLLAYRQGNYRQAEQLHREAVLLAHDSGTVQEAAAVNSLAVVLTDLGEFDEAKDLFEKALELGSAAYGPESDKVALTLANLASLHISLGDYREAERMLQHATAIDEKTLNANNPQCATTKQLLAKVKRKLGLNRESEQLLKEALTIQVKAFGWNHPAVGGTLLNLSAYHYEQGNFVEAENACRDAISVFDMSLDTTHIFHMHAANSLALILLEKGDFAESERLLVRSIEIYRSFGHDNSCEIANVYDNLASLYERTGRYSEALDWVKKSLSISTTLFGKGHVHVAHDLLILARVSKSAGSLADARQYAQEALDCFHSAEGKETDLHLNVTYLLAAIEDELSNTDQALLHMRNFLTIAERELPADRKLVISLYNYGAFLLQHGQVEEGRQYLVKASQVVLDEGSMEHGIALYGLATAYCKTEDYSRAEEYGQQSLKILRDHTQNQPDMTISCLTMLGGIKYRMNHAVEAESLYKEAFRLWESLGKPDLDEAGALFCNYMLLEIEQRKLEKAKALLDLLQKYDEKNFVGTSNTEMAIHCSSYASYYEAIGLIDKAIEYFERSIDVWRQLGWPRNPNLFHALKNYSLLLRSQRHYVELEPILRQALDLCPDIYGAKSRDAAIIMNDLGVTLTACGRRNEAVEFYKRALDTWKALSWPKDEGVMMVHNNYFGTAMMMHKYQLAVSVAQSALTYAERLFGRRHPAIVGRLINIGVAYREWHKFDRANNFFEKAMRMVNATLGQDHLELSIVLRNLARLRQAQGRKKVAKNLEEQAKLIEQKQRLNGQLRIRPTVSRGTPPAPFPKGDGG
jgi:tetratricopeptide (TPR) repeat protein/predicted MPP superfamily phosphohydrolase